MTIKFYLEKERNQSNTKPEQKTTKGHKVRERTFNTVFKIIKNNLTKIFVGCFVLL